MKLSIDPELRDLIPPLAPDELDRLRASIIAAGRARDPILACTLDGACTIVDGHNRYTICTELGLPYTVELLDLGDRAAIHAWMLDHQIGRRNLSPDQVAIICAGVGITPPPFAAALMPRARALVADAPDLAAKVRAGRLKVRAAANDLARRRGAPQRKRAAPVAPAAPAAPPDPLAEHRARVEDKRARTLLASQVSRLDTLERTVEAWERVASAPARPILVPEYAPARRRVGCAVALLSDLHYGEVVHAADSTRGNAYDTTIAETRLERFFTGVEALIEKERGTFEIERLVLWLGGDLITGHIHDDLAETALGPTESILALAPLLIAGVRRLEARGVKITMPCSYGNHGRTTVKKRVETGASHSYEWMLYQQLARALPSVEVVANPTPHQYVEVYGRTLHFTHGDDCRYQGGVGGISIPLNKASDAWGKVKATDLHHYGHFHQALAGRSWMVNGSVIGYNEFAMSIKAEPEEPQQWFYILDSKRGRTAMSPIWVAE